jgi:hypothetical protein
MLKNPADITPGELRPGELRPGELYIKRIPEAQLSVKGHKSVRLMVEGSVSFDETIFPKSRLALPAYC